MAEWRNLPPNTKTRNQYSAPAEWLLRSSLVADWFFVMILASFVPVPRFSVRHPQILKRGINAVHPQNGFYVLPLCEKALLLDRDQISCLRSNIIGTTSYRMGITNSMWAGHFGPLLFLVLQENISIKLLLFGPRSCSHSGVAGSGTIQQDSWHSFQWSIHYSHCDQQHTVKASCSQTSNQHIRTGQERIKQQVKVKRVQTKDRATAECFSWTCQMNPSWPQKRLHPDPGQGYAQIRQKKKELPWVLKKPRTSRQNGMVPLIRPIWYFWPKKVWAMKARRSPCMRN